MFLLSVGLPIAVYVLQSLSYYTLAKRRGINNPWLAWVPVGDLWIRGCISDQYRYVSKGQVRNKRKWLLGLNIALYAVYVLFFVAFGAFVVSMFMYETTPDAIEKLDLTALLGMVIISLAILGICIALLVLSFMALYDLFCSCEPDNAVLYFVLGLFVPFLQTIFLFVCREKDLGMPPRRPQPVEPVYNQPIEPWENNPEE